MNDITRVAILGAGVIGSSWAALMLAAGYEVTVYDPDASAEDSTRRYIDAATPTLDALGLKARGGRGNLVFSASALAAVSRADFVQENVPERLRLKHDLYRQIEPALQPHAIVATSASGLPLSELQAGWRNPARFLLGHPFNPPHLIPLVEIMSNESTSAGVADAAERFYRSLGKVTIRVRKEVPGHIANRLQAALWREAIHLMAIGAASVEDIDTAVWAGPGLRWAAMGPSLLFHLGAGPGGLAEFCKRYGESFERWWDDLGDARLDAATASALVSGVNAEAKDKNWEQLCGQRDKLILALLTASAPIRQAAE